MQIIVEARKNAAVDALYKKVEAQTPIILKPISGPTWTSATENGQTTIQVGTARSPEAALFHELLHADLKQSGYPEPPFGVSKNPASKGMLMALFNALGNELQHHRIYPTFAAAGFTPAQFYGDDDKSAFLRVREGLRKMKPSDPAAHFLLKLLTIIAPGGHGDGEERRKLRTFFYLKCSASTKAKMEKIEAIIASWASSSVMDPKPTMAEIIDALADYAGTWIGGSTNFPSDGIFVGPQFDISEAIDLRP